MSKLYAYFDGQSFYASCKAYGFTPDYKLLTKWLRQRGDLVRAYYYTPTLPPDETGTQPMRPLLDWLQYNGFAIISKPSREYSNGDGSKRTKCTLDVELAVDLVLDSARADEIVLFSGDGSLRYAVQAAQRNCRIAVVSALRLQPPQISDDLRRQADEFIDLEDLRPIIGKEMKPEPTVMEEKLGRRRATAEA